jgi:hypothetical protein
MKCSVWKFRGGLGGMDETAVVGLVKNWTAFLGAAWSDSQTTKAWPAFWRASFTSPLEEGVFPNGNVGDRGDRPRRSSAETTPG